VLLATTGTALDGVVTVTAVDASITNEIQTITASGIGPNYDIDLSLGGGNVTLTQGINTLLTRTGNAITFSAIIPAPQTFNNTSNATSHTITLTGGGGSTEFIEGGGILITTGGSPFNGTATIEAVDASITNEIQTITASGAGPTSFNLDLSLAGGSVTLTEGANIDLTRTGNTVTIAATGGGAPAGANHQIQYFNSGNFGADANMNFNPTNKRFVVGTTTPTAVIHGRGQDNAADRVFLAENQAANDILTIFASGNIKLGDNETYPIMKQTVVSGGVPTYTATGITIESQPSTNGTDMFGINHPATGLNSGDYNIVRQNGTWNPSNGTATYDSWVIDPTINVSSSATGLARGVAVTPTITNALGGYESFSTDLNAGTARWAFRGSGTANARFGGALGVGGDPLTGFQIYATAAARFDGAILSRGVGTTPINNLATPHLRLWNTTGSTGDTWFLSSLNNGNLALRSDNLGADQIVVENTSGQVQITNNLRLGTFAGTSTRLVGVDATGQTRDITVGAGLTLSGNTLSAGAKPTEITIYTAVGDNVFAVPAGTRSITVVLVGPGGGGGSGRKGAAATNRAGGGGGSGGAVTEITISILELGSPANITFEIGAGGAGGAAQVNNGGNGNVGASPTDTNMKIGADIVAVAGGGTGGNGGTAITGAGGGAENLGDWGSNTGGGGGTGVGNTAATSIKKAAGSGSGGGGISNTNALATGGAGGIGFFGLSAGGAGGAIATNGGNAAAVAFGRFSGGGGGGGGSGAAISGIGGAGARGGGGGGGAAGVDASHDSGAGGAGANGWVMVIANF